MGLLLISAFHVPSVQSIREKIGTIQLVSGECSGALHGRLRRDGDPVQLRQFERESAKKGPEHRKLKYLHC
jgi:hypothetical protein